MAARVQGKGARGRVASVKGCGRDQGAVARARGGGWSSGGVLGAHRHVVQRAQVELRRLVQQRDAHVTVGALGEVRCGAVRCGEVRCGEVR